MTRSVETGLCQGDALSSHEIARMTAIGLRTVEITHDLRNLIQVVGSAVGLIDRHLQPNANASVRELIASALDSVERATKLSRRLLDASEPGRDPDELLQLAVVLSEIRHIVVLSAGPSIAVEFVISEGLPAILCQRVDLDNVVLNLVANARDAMNGVGRITISIHNGITGHMPHETGAVTSSDIFLRVTDTGCGMMPEVAAQAFEPFFTTKPSGQGTGLGLAMVGNFVRRIGGTAAIESVRGRGTSVVLRLPVRSRKI
jgi:signal transduction histidine kinase